MPLYILGSSLFGAGLAAEFRLPYAFASHFAPDALQDAVAMYHRDFKPSSQISEPYLIAGVNVVAADRKAEAHENFRSVLRRRIALFTGADRALSDEEADMTLETPQGRQIAHMLRYSAVGTPEDVAEHVAAFTEHADADELIVVHQSTNVEVRLRSVELLAEVVGLPAPRPAP